MNYPYWDTGAVTGGQLIALIAILHVFVAHIAVGGGLFTWWLDARARRRGDALLDGFLRRWSRAFLLLTLVFGAVTGVGIWFVIGLAQPAATSSLIHTFVFGWAIEWVFFLGEIVALLVYVYRFDALARRDRTRVAFLYALFAWLSLVVIDGILAFMLTPGDWPVTRSFWDGFLNPSYLPSLAFRTAAAVFLAGVFGALVGAWQTDPAARQRVTRAAVAWVLLGALALVPTALWYLRAIPAPVRATGLVANPETGVFLELLLLAFAVVVALALAVRWAPRRAQQAIAALMVLVALGWMGAFEYVRELSRRPWVVPGHLYSNGLTPADVARADEAGFLASARFVAPAVRAGGDPLAQGAALFGHQCRACHTVGGRNDIRPLVADWSPLGVEALIEGLGVRSPHMPPFAGTDAERAALAAWLVSLRGPAPPPPIAAARPAPPPVPPLLPATGHEDEYVLLAWSEAGWQNRWGADGWFELRPPESTLLAQLVRRGDPPEVVTDGVTLAWTALPATAVAGDFAAPDDGGAWRARGVPLAPRGGNAWAAYRRFAVEARDATTKEVLARAPVTVPVALEPGCGRCHGGGPAGQPGAGLSEAGAAHVLAVHDARSGTSLLAEARAGRPQPCRACHPEASGRGLGLSAAIHGAHAALMPVRGGAACDLCHPTGADGPTAAFRGVHAELGLSCVECHGTLTDHALSLLNAEAAREPGGAGRVAALLRPDAVPSAQDVKPRRAWDQQPDCLTCHQEFQAPEETDAFNRWVAAPDQLYRERSDEVGLRCAACHGAPHALYPVVSERAPNHDNLLSFQTMGAAGPIGSGKRCTVCHEEPPEDEAHHPNTLRDFRNEEILEGLQEQAPKRATP